MSLSDFRDDLIAEVTAMTDGTIVHKITKTLFVPSIEDPNITYPNLTTGEQKSKLLETAVLFVDLRESTRISLNHGEQELSGLYSAYVRAMSRAGRYHGGKVRNIIGDRLMVVFDRDECFEHAFKTAVLMNSVAKYVLDKHISLDTIKCGIGIDFGEMLITKTGFIKQGSENPSNKSLVWLGKPANVASKLTDVANKPNGLPALQVQEHHHYPAINEFGHYVFSADCFLDRLDTGSSLDNKLVHESEYFFAFDKTYSSPNQNPPILMTQDFFDGLKADKPYEEAIVDGWISERNIKIKGYDRKIYGGDVIKTVFQD